MDAVIDFHVRGARSDTIETLRDYAVRRLSFAIKRFRHRVRRVTVRLIDENGPRRGVDTRCSLTAELNEGGPLFVQAMAAWPFAAITLGAGRLSEALRRDAERHSVRRGRSGTPSPRPESDRQVS